MQQPVNVRNQRSFRQGVEYLIQHINQHEGIRIERPLNIQRSGNKELAKLLKGADLPKHQRFGRLAVTLCEANEFSRVKQQTYGKLGRLCVREVVDHIEDVIDRSLDHTVVVDVTGYRFFGPSHHQRVGLILSPKPLSTERALLTTELNHINEKEINWRPFTPHLTISENYQAILASLDETGLPSTVTLDSPRIRTVFNN
jgi:hypothetical protein